MHQKYLAPGFDFALAHAVEEAGEFLAAAGKTQRFGIDSVNPELPPYARETNGAWLRREMADLRGALDRLEAELDPMTDRDRLPQRRQSDTITFDHGGFSYVATIGYRPEPDGRIGEIFLDSGKTGTALSIATKDAAIAVSLALQHGCTIETLRGAFLRNADGTAAGVMACLFDLLAPPAEPR
ncbi:hypothetical protein FFK22_008900 [Mycobacterium sp. KBS0706]|uniref:TSCPD domain-containing protein n=1 Tax=Mycobacterium sp. KBS0706 TaxID=2578109 RepID=UPI00110FC939|nr:hypothetical protein [Mycobacterium sp. KBS0706]TSD89089.1 hypothetical protein FFK22_008900 [Mycobacterium sp. KBS0706]